MFDFLKPKSNDIRSIYCEENEPHEPQLTYSVSAKVGPFKRINHWKFSSDQVKEECVYEYVRVKVAQVGKVVSIGLYRDEGQVGGILIHRMYGPEQGSSFRVTTTPDKKEQTVCRLLEEYQDQMHKFYDKLNEEDRASYNRYKQEQRLTVPLEQDLKDIVSRCGYGL